MRKARLKLATRLGATHVFNHDGRALRGVIQGDSVPDVFIPQLVDHMMAGRFPLNLMVKHYKLADINRAAAESSTGKAIKPVIRMGY